jgi:hypothetical protein
MQFLWLGWFLGTQILLLIAGLAVIIPAEVSPLL